MLENYLRTIEESQSKQPLPEIRSRENSVKSTPGVPTNLHKNVLAAKIDLLGLNNKKKIQLLNKSES